MANKLMKTLTIGENTYEIVDQASRTAIESLQDNRLLLTAGTLIPENSDLNDYTAQGNYRCVSSTVAATLTNTPHTSTGFKLTVFSTANDNAIMQEIIANANSIKIYRRVVVKINNVWQFYDWKEMFTTDGGTLTGDLIVADSYPYVRTATPEGDPIAALYGSVNEHKAYLCAFSKGTGYYEGYGLPAADNGLTAHKWYKILTSKETVTIGQGGTGATTAPKALENLGALPLAGGTMTGWLTAPRFTVQSTDGYPAVAYNNADGNQVGALHFNASTHRFYVSQKATDTNYNENYILPTVATGLTETKTYNFITSKGGTVTGTLGSTKTSQAYTIGTSAKPTLTAISMGTNDPGTRMYFTHYDQNSSYYENFVLPGTKDLTKNGNHWILTTKSAVTIAQGGTGATTPEAARTALGITPTNIGALPLSGGTLTGELNCVLSSNNYYIRYRTSTTATTDVASLRFNGASGYRRFAFAQQSAGTGGYTESYVLPRVSNSITANATYDILTTKTAVNIEQGGTGATTPEAARTALGITPANIGAAPTSHTHQYLTTYSGTGEAGFGISDSGFWMRARRAGSNGAFANAEYLYMTKDGQKVYTYDEAGTYISTMYSTVNKPTLSALGDVIVSTTTPTTVTNGKWYLVKQG